MFNELISQKLRQTGVWGVQGGSAEGKERGWEMGLRTLTYVRGGSPALNMHYHVSQLQRGSWKMWSWWDTTARFYIKKAANSDMGGGGVTFNAIASIWLIRTSQPWMNYTPPPPPTPYVIICIWLIWRSRPMAMLRPKLTKALIKAFCCQAVSHFTLC